MTIEHLHQRFLQSSEAFTDTRKIVQNGMFFALKGDNFNGNEFALEALQQGARFAVVDQAEFASDERLILVEDVLSCLQELAAFHRRFCPAKVIGLTGSNGKTTTKELILGVLSGKFKALATVGNLNNHIGVPLTLLRIRKDTELAIVEMGANHKGEIRALSNLAQPDYGYITNFGKAHLEGFGSLQGVIEGKSELYDYLKQHKGHIFYNGDDPTQIERIGEYTHKSAFGSLSKADLTIRPLGGHPFVSFEINSTQVSTQLVGAYNLNNCAAAALVGKHFGVSTADIKKALESYLPSNNRSQLIQKTGHRILLDAYNANPSSMKAALENFKHMDSPRKTVFLGDMFELGKAAEEEHQLIADLVADMNFDEVFLIGENFSKVDTRFKTFDSFSKFEAFIKDQKLEPATILIKGSRGMALERILSSL